MKRVRVVASGRVQGVFYRASCARLLIGDEEMDVSPPLAGERAHALDVHPGLARHLAEPGQLARPILENDCHIRGHRAAPRPDSYHWVAWFR